MLFRCFIANLFHALGYFCLHDQLFKVFDFARDFLIFCLENEKSCVDAFDVALMLFFQIDFSGVAFYPKSECRVPLLLFFPDFFSLNSFLVSFVLAELNYWTYRAEKK